jgi:glutaminase
MTCSEFSPFFFSFANEGKTKEGKQILTKSQVKRLMFYANLRFYDESGSLI